MKIARSASCAWFIALAAALACGQTAPSSASNLPAQEVPVLINAGDLLDISVYDNPDMLQEVRVETGGMINLNLIGAAKVGGMTARQAGDWIAQQYSDRRILVQPQVTVLIKENSSQGVSITGEVNHPGVYPLLSSRTALDVISLAGGLTNLADTHVTIKHRSGTQERVTVKLSSDEAGSALDENAVVYPGDLVVVPRAGVVYVLGDVGRPCGLAMQDNGKISLLQALAQAGGANYTSALNRAYLLHKREAGYVTERVKINDMLRGKISDMQLVKNDILFIPPSTIKHLAEDTQSIASSVAGAMVIHGGP